MYGPPPIWTATGRELEMLRRNSVNVWTLSDSTFFTILAVLVLLTIARRHH